MTFKTVPAVRLSKKIIAVRHCVIMLSKINSRASNQSYWVSKWAKGVRQLCTQRHHSTKKPQKGKGTGQRTAGRVETCSCFHEPGRSTTWLTRKYWRNNKPPILNWIIYLLWIRLNLYGCWLSVNELGLMSDGQPLPVSLLFHNPSKIGRYLSQKPLKSWNRLYCRVDANQQNEITAAR